jgi:hypothetical protein
MRIRAWQRGQSSTSTGSLLALLSKLHGSGCLTHVGREGPAWLEMGYRAAWDDLARFALEDLRSSKDSDRITTALAVVALARGQTKLGAFLAFLDESELDELVEDRLAWSELYVRDGG